MCRFPLLLRLAMASAVLWTCGARGAVVVPMGTSHSRAVLVARGSEPPGVSESRPTEAPSPLIFLPAALPEDDLRRWESICDGAFLDDLWSTNELTGAMRLLHSHDLDDVPRDDLRPSTLRSLAARWNI